MRRARRWAVPFSSYPLVGAHVIETLGLPENYEPPSASLTPPHDTVPVMDVNETLDASMHNDVLVASSEFDGDPEEDGIDLMVSITLFNRWTISASHFPAEDGQGISEDDVVRLCDAVAVAAKAMFT